MRLSRPRTLVCALLVAIGLAACGGSGTSHHAGGQETGLSVADANNDGSYVTANGITYQLQVSRELNQYSTEDSQYVRGVPAGTTDPGPTQEWYGVFLWAKNQTHQTRTTSDNFEIVDTQGNTYDPLKLDTAVNPFAWTAQTLAPLATEPGVDTVASYGPTQGALLLFKISTDAYANRPLTLYILSSSGKKLASISLDL